MKRLKQYLIDTYENKPYVLVVFNQHGEANSRGFFDFDSLWDTVFTLEFLEAEYEVFSKAHEWFEVDIYGANDETEITLK